MKKSLFTLNIGVGYEDERIDHVKASDLETGEYAQTGDKEFVVCISRSTLYKTLNFLSPANQPVDSSV